MTSKHKENYKESKDIHSSSPEEIPQDNTAVTESVKELKQRYEDVLSSDDTIDEALKTFDKNSGTIIKDLSSTDPSILRRAIEKARISQEAMKIAHDRLKQKRRAQELASENATGEDKVKSDRFKQQRAAIQADTSNHASEKWSNYISVPLQGAFGGVIGGILGGLGKGLGKFWYGLRSTRDDYKQKKAERLLNNKI
ncbi:hypothetical protein GF369_04305 [Candidatus Peregrinibacteria bacterium]|nr:hypothetical protein [Candidatus Peregrinibacteria bacterium]